ERGGAGLGGTGGRRPGGRRWFGRAGAAGSGGRPAATAGRGGRPGRDAPPIGWAGRWTLRRRGPHPRRAPDPARGLGRRVAGAGRLVRPPPAPLLLRPARAGGSREPSFAGRRWGDHVPGHLGGGGAGYLRLV